MPVDVRLEGEEKLLRALEAMRVAKNPRIGRRAFGRSASLFRTHARSSHLSGPAPRRLRRETGATATSLTIDATGLPHEVVIGIPGGREWAYAEAYELGRWFGNRWQGGRRPFIQPTIEDLLDDFPAIYVEAWESEVRVP